MKSYCIFGNVDMRIFIFLLENLKKKFSGGIKMEENTLK